MTAHALWLWLHEAMQGIPAWLGTLRGVAFSLSRDHDFERGHEGHTGACFAGFIDYLRGEPLAASYRAPEAAIALMERARAAWNGQVYGDERDATLEEMKR